jgi:hypothetical protein
MLKLLEEIENRAVTQAALSHVIGVASTYMKKGGRTPFEAATQAKKTFSHGTPTYDVNVTELERMLYEEILKYMIQLNSGKKTGPDLLKCFEIALDYFNQPTKFAKQFAVYAINRLGDDAFGVGVTSDGIASVYKKPKKWSKMRHSQN